MSTDISCACGHTVLRVEGQPILATECMCTSCRTAGAHLQTLPDAPPVLDDKGATPFVIYRKDRVSCVSGADTLREYRLTPDASTRRVVATCCNSPMFLEFTKGHWLSLYGQRWPAGTMPAIELRTMTGDLPEGTVLPGDVPNPKSHTLSFFAKLLGAWAAMGFRTPKIDYVNGKLDAR